MRYTRLAIALLLFAGWAQITCAQETNVEKLLGKSNPAIQAQIQRVYGVLQKPAGPQSNVDILQETEALKKLSDDKEQLINQLLIFVAITKSEEDSHVFAAGMILSGLDFKPSILIRVFAPCLEAENPQLRAFATIWFTSHDNPNHAWQAESPFEPVNFKDYLNYVRSKLSRKEEIPAGFVKYMYERSPGRALLVFAYCNSVDVTVARMQAIRKAIEKRHENASLSDDIPPLPPAVETAPQKRGEPELPAKTEQQLKEEDHARRMERREIELAEHIISNAIWLNKNGFTDRFRAALPEANEQLDKLAKGEWWAKLYVIYIMRQNSPLLREEVLRNLAEDENDLVSKAAKSNK